MTQRLMVLGANDIETQTEGIAGFRLLKLSFVKSCLIVRPAKLRHQHRILSDQQFP